MPLYEYVCRSCSHRFETLLRAWSDSASCPRCDGEEVERQLSTFAMAGFSGSSRGGAMPMMGGGCARPGGCGCGAGGCAH